MGPLTVFCPTSRRPIDSGVNTDWPTILRHGRLTIRVVCPECGENHEVRLKDGYVARAEFDRNTSLLSRSPRLKRLLHLVQSTLR
jgi:hypothetical protein